MLGLPKTSGLPVRERALIDHGLKWWPTKKYTANLTNNGTSASWRLEINSLTRAEANYPAEGVPFALILTIEDASDNTQSSRPSGNTCRRAHRCRRHPHGASHQTARLSDDACGRHLLRSQTVGPAALPTSRTTHLSQLVFNVAGTRCTPAFGPDRRGDRRTHGFEASGRPAMTRFPPWDCEPCDGWSWHQIPGRPPQPFLPLMMR